MPNIRRSTITLLLVASVAVPLPALAQTAAPAASSSTAVPSVNANRWNGKDHQPTAAAEPPLSAKRKSKEDHTLNSLDKQLLDQKLPKAPAGSP